MKPILNALAAGIIFCSGNASVHLIAKVSGNGDIYCSGNPTNPEKKLSGNGSIKG